jgi:hypothetical protein
MSGPNRICAICGLPLALVVLAATLTSCGSTSGAPGTSTRSSTSSCSRVKLVSEHANGGTVHLCVGQPLVVRLHSTYWSSPTSSSAAVLRRAGPTRVRPAPATACVPGAGCGTSTTRFSAVGPGTAHVAAQRQLCGEALRCTKSRRSFVLVVVVRRPGG